VLFESDFGFIDLGLRFGVDGLSVHKIRNEQPIIENAFAVKTFLHLFFLRYLLRENGESRNLCAECCAKAYVSPVLAYY